MNNSKQNNIYPAFLIIVLMLLIINLLSTIIEYNDYQKRIKSGNNRWLQVEERIKEIERCCNGRNG